MAFYLDKWPQKNNSKAENASFNMTNTQGSLEIYLACKTTNPRKNNQKDNPGKQKEAKIISLILVSTTKACIVTKV